MVHPIQAKTVASLFKEACLVHKERVAFATRVKATLWKPTTYGEVDEMATALATALIDLGVKQKEHVGLLSDNRLEWTLADWAIQFAGAADVPRGTDVTEADIEYILPHSDAKVCFVENLELWKKIESVKRKLHVKTFILMNAEQKAPSGVLHLYDLIEKGRQLRKKGDTEVEKRIEKIKADDLFTLIYTSGTTGSPKGVMLTHRNIIFNIERIPADLGPFDRVLTLLPVWHIFERAFETYTISRGAATYYTSIRTFGEDMRNVQPSFMGSAPRLWENLYLRILDNVQSAHPVRRFLFHSAYAVAEVYKGSAYYLRNRTLHLTKPNPIVKGILWLLHLVRFILITPLYGLFNTAVLERIRQASGGSLKASISGGGALPLHVDKFFNYIGIPVLEGYGMTETAPVISARTADNLIIGTVGPLMRDTKIRIMDLNGKDILFPNPKKPYEGRGLKGEIHILGDQVMQGYYKNADATKKVLHDGWLNTGDVGMITFNDCLKIMGRSKDTIVLVSGENIEPVPIENRLLQSPLVDNIIVVGQDQKHLAALIVPSLEGFKASGIDAKNVAELSKNPETLAALVKVVKTEISADNGFKGFERLPEIRLVPKAFEVGEELTNLFKLKRHVITEKYESLIDDIYKGAKK